MYPVQISSFFDILSQSQKAYSRQLEPVCKKWNVSRSEMDVLLFLYNNPGYDRAADIVTHRGMTKSHVSMSVANLCDLELLVRNFSEVDRRTAHLELTDRGREIAAEGKQAQQEFFARLYQGVPEEELELVKNITRKVCENIENINKT
jgi:MarR family transcriptional regulator for hemolysin